MRKFILLTLALVVANSAGYLRADAPTKTLSSIASFVDDQTIVIVRCNLAGLDLETVKPWIESLSKSAGGRKRLSVVGHLCDWCKREETVRKSQLYIISTIGQLPSPEQMRDWNDAPLIGILANTTFAVIPQASHEAIEELHKTLLADAKQFWPEANANMRLDCRDVHGDAVIGMGKLLDQVDKQKPTVRLEFDAAIEAAGNQPLCAAIVPPRIFARAATEILRTPLPGSTQPIGPILAKGFLWAAIGVQPNQEQFSANLTIQSANNDAASQLAETIKRFAAFISASQVAESNSPASAAMTAAIWLPWLSILPEAKGNRLVLSLDGQNAQEFASFAQLAVSRAQASTWHNQSMNNMKQIALGILNYEDTHREMPDRAIRDKNGKPLLSWRVAILPQMDEAALYKEFHLDEPWDSEHNRKLIERLPKVYSSPDTADSHPGRTRYLAVVGEHCIFPPDRAIKMKEISDGTSHTIMVVEADPDHAVIWTKPDDQEVDLDNPTRGLADEHQIFNAVFADGHSEAIEGSIDPKTLRALFTRDGGEAIKR